MNRQTIVWKYAKRLENTRGRELVYTWGNINRRIDIGKNIKKHHRQKIKWNAQRNTAKILKKQLSHEASIALLIRTVEQILRRHNITYTKNMES